ncbi:MAG: hypothetical protein ACERKZ_02835 [Lachnotalea sp.]
MHSSSSEQRVAMIQNIREISANNEKTINNIHNLVSNSSPIDIGVKKGKTMFFYRAIFAIIVFGIYALLDIGKVEFNGYNTNKVEKMIEYNLDYQEVFKQINIQLTNATKSE